MRFPGIALTIVSISCLACGPGWDPNQGNNTPDASARPDGRDTNEFADARPPEVCSKMDIVFVVDDSGSMSEEQANLADNFPVFAQVLENYQTPTGVQLDYRVAVTTTGRDLDYTIAPPPPFPSIPMSENGDNGEFRPVSGAPRRWIERADGNLTTTFASIARVGTGGPSIEMPLLMLDWALTDRAADTNAGFLRDDALLAFVILTDEDDCSRPDNNFTVANDACSDSIPQVVPVADFIAGLDTLKGDRGRWAAAVIAGPNDCTTSFGDAIEARRLKDFVTQTGENAIFSSICDADLAGSLEDAIIKFDAACQSFPPID